MSKQTPHLAPSLLGFLDLMLARAGEREERRQRIYRAIGRTTRFRDGPEGSTGRPADARAAEAVVAEARAAKAGTAEAEAGPRMEHHIAPPMAPPAPLRPLGLTLESGPAALVRLLSAHVERAARRDSLLEAVSRRPAARITGLAQMPLYGAPGYGPPMAEAAPALQAPPAPQALQAPQVLAVPSALHVPPPHWMPSWLSPPPDGLAEAGATVPAPLPETAAPHARGPAPGPAPSGALPAPAPGLAPPAAPDQLREHLARILRDDALRHGLDLKGE